jgi:NAD(P)-dependent dehydrogenase (short-subunit alcohol dehydrogenase family)
VTAPIAFVTGASRGIGKAIAISLARAGYDLVVSARTVHQGETHDNTLTVHKSDTRPLPGSLDETAAAIAEAGQRALSVPLDLTDRASVGAAAQRILDTWGGVDVIVHNGRYIGPGLMDLFFDIPVDAFDKFVEAHGIAPFVLTRALLPGMLAKGAGQVVTITSAAAFTVPPAPAGQGGWGLGYAVGKGSGHQLVPTLHAEFAARGIRAFNVEPGFVATERNAIVVRDFGFEPTGGAPPEAIGSVVAWLLAAPEADGLRGSTIDAQALCRERQLHPEWDSAHVTPAHAKSS